MTVADVVSLADLKRRAPATWAATAEYYAITGKYLPAGTSDLDRIVFANTAIEELERVK